MDVVCKAFPSIKKLDLSYQLESFLEILVNGCSDLNCLKINYKNAPSTNAIRTLKRFGHLKELAFSDAHVADRSTFWYSVEALSQLEWIDIYPVRAVNKFDTKYLDHHRPEIKVIVHNRAPRL